MERTGQNRAINRRKLEYREAEALLEEAERTVRAACWPACGACWPRAPGTRRSTRMGPSGSWAAGGGSALFCLERTSPDGREKVLCLHNVSGQPEVFRERQAGARRPGGST